MSSRKTTIKKVKDVAEATALVQEWFEQENKPVTSQSLTDALGSRVTKTLIQKILEQLHSEEKLNVKELKKIRFYYLRQAGTAVPAAASAEEEVSCPLSPPPDGEEQQPTEDQQSPPFDVEKSSGNAAAAAADALVAVAESAVALCEAHRSLAHWRSFPSQEGRRAQQQALTDEIEQLTADLEEAPLQSPEGRVSSAQTSGVSTVRQIVRRYRRARQLWVERRRWAMRLLEATGGDQHSAQQVAALLGCTMDVEAGVSFEASAVPLPPQLLRELPLT